MFWFEWQHDATPPVTPNELSPVPITFGMPVRAVSTGTVVPWGEGDTLDTLVGFVVDIKDTYVTVKVGDSPNFYASFNIGFEES